MKGGRYLEDRHVQRVYDAIAPCFNNIPQKVWPNVRKFIKSIPSGSVVADIGCGNGRYLHINKSVYKIGVDACLPLIELSREKGYEVLSADNLNLPFRDGAFDAVVSIGVLHHFSTEERRIRALKELTRITGSGGQILIYVWAYEQKRRKFEGQDVLVPWHAGKRSKYKGQFPSDQDVSGTSSVSEDDSLDLPYIQRTNSVSSCPCSQPMIQRTISDPSCPCCQDPQSSVLTCSSKDLCPGKRSNTLPSSFDVLTGHHHGSNEIAEECRRLQSHLQEMSACHDQLSSSTDSVFCNEDQGISFTTPTDDKGDNQDLSHAATKEENGLTNRNLFKAQVIEHKDQKPTKNQPKNDSSDFNSDKSTPLEHIKPGKASFFDSLKKRFLKFIDSKFSDDLSEKVKEGETIKSAKTRKTTASSSDGEGDRTLENHDKDFETFAVREFPMSSCRDLIISSNGSEEKNTNMTSELAIINQSRIPNQDSQGTTMSVDIISVNQEGGKQQYHDNQGVCSYRSHDHGIIADDSCNGDQKKNSQEIQTTLALTEKHVEHNGVCENKLDSTKNFYSCDSRGLCNITHYGMNGADDGGNRSHALSDVNSGQEADKLFIYDFQMKCSSQNVSGSCSKGNKSFVIGNKNIIGDKYSKNIENISDHIKDKKFVTHQNGDLDEVCKFPYPNSVDSHINETDYSCFSDDKHFNKNYSRDVNLTEKNPEMIRDQEHRHINTTTHKSLISENAVINKLGAKSSHNQSSYLNCSDRKCSSQTDLSIYSSSGAASSVPSLSSLETEEEFLMSSQRLCRFYHVFKEGELSSLIKNSVDNLSVVSCIYDHGNWCLIAKKT